MLWWKKAFNKAYIKNYEWQEKWTDVQVAFIVRHKWHKGYDSSESILDVACGYGRHANLLAFFGHHVVGIDQSNEMLNYAELHSVGYANFKKHDIRKPFKHEQFQNVINMFTSFGFFSDKENKQVLKNMVDALKPGGVLILDFVNPEWVKTDKDNVVKKGVWLFKDNGIVGKIHLYDKQWFKRNFKRLGLGSVRVYGDYNDKPYSKKSWRMIFVARKK